MARPEDSSLNPNDQHEAGLSLKDAAEAFDLSLRTLSNRVRNGEIPASKRRGPWGDEWRVTTDALEQFGYKRRSSGESSDSTSEPRVVRLQRDLAAAHRALAAERNRANEADRMLGAAMREVGRLRAALQRTQDDTKPTHLIDLMLPADQAAAQQHRDAP